MRFIHTSDWHIGHRLYGRKRLKEFEQFLDWLASYIEEREIEGLLVAGDVFDTTTPGNGALGLYYRFLCRLGGSSCRHVVIVAGNHDSPSLLEAPRELLRELDIHVIGSPGSLVEDEVLLLHDQQGVPEMIVCAVPFLRDRDIRTATAGESMEDKAMLLRQGIEQHYEEVAIAAAKVCNKVASTLPVVAMGHLFAAGGKTSEDDGVRELYLGGLSHISAKSFPESIDYLALGHLHLAQLVGGSDKRRYSGSPLPMSFADGQQQKYILEVNTDGPAVTVAKVSLPSFQQLVTLRGDLSALSGQLEALQSKGSRAWVEIEYTGSAVVANLREQLFNVAAESDFEILRIRNNRVYDHALKKTTEQESLDDLSVNEVFERCLDQAGVPDEQCQELRHSMAEVVAALHEEDGEV